MTHRYLGIRTSADLIRYAVIECGGGSCKLLNQNKSANWLPFPATATTPAEKLIWFEQELQRVIRANGPIDGLAIKMNELARGIRSETLASRESAYLDAVALMVARQQNIRTATYLYASLGTSSKDVKTDAEAEVGRTAKNWDVPLADAIVAAVKLSRA